jgi:hypothetical protein
MKTRKFNLDFEDSQDFEVLAICSHEPDYKLVWTVNKFASLDLIRSENQVSNYSKKGELISNHVQFEFYDHFSETNFLLVKNKEQKYTLVHELELIDFFLFIATEHQYPTENIREKLLESESIIAVYKINSSQIKSLNRLEIF